MIRGIINSLLDTYCTVRHVRPPLWFLVLWFLLVMFLGPAAH